jgi:glycosyltransferase involved in cell wall biosynthesis
VRDGENGFLVPVGDDRALGARLRQLLEDRELRQRMGEAGYARAHGELNEKTYVAEFARMVENTVGGTEKSSVAAGGSC